MVVRYAHFPWDPETKRRKFVRLALNLVYSRTRHFLDIQRDRYTNLISVSHIIHYSNDMYKMLNFFEETFCCALMKFQNWNMTVVYEENIRDKNKMETIKYRWASWDLLFICEDQGDETNKDKMNVICSTTAKTEEAILLRRPQGNRNLERLRVESRRSNFLKIFVGIIEPTSLIRF
jgi:hypothetical protein